VRPFLLVAIITANVLAIWFTTGRAADAIPTWSSASRVQASVLKGRAVEARVDVLEGAVAALESERQGQALSPHEVVRKGREPRNASQQALRGRSRELLAEHASTAVRPWSSAAWTLDSTGRERQRGGVLVVAHKVRAHRSPRKVAFTLSAQFSGQLAAPSPESQLRERGLEGLLGRPARARAPPLVGSERPLVA
jgi:hypothetical protein